MSELSPEEKKKIYEEEKLRVEARAKAEDEAKSEKTKKGCLGCLAAVVIIAIIAIVIVLSGSDDQDTSGSGRPEFQQMPYSADQAEAYKQFFLGGWSDIVSQVEIKGSNPDRMTAEIWVDRAALARLSEEESQDFVIMAIHEWWIRGGYEVIFRDHRTDEIITRHLAEEGPRLLGALQQRRG